MIKRLICLLWGHKTVVETYRAENDFACVYARLDFCRRCGKDVKK